MHSGLNETKPHSPSTDPLRVDVLAYDDVTGLLDLFFRAIPYSQLGRSIYAARGAARYLGCLFQHAELHPQEQIWGIRNPAGQLLAAAHSRSLPASNHLAYLAVEPGLQGMGIGSLAMDHWEALARGEGARALTLDVADENAGAQRLYRRRGFEVAQVTHEYRLLEPAEPLRSPGFRLSGWPQAMASYEAFGFGRFALQWEDQEVSVDLVEGFFRTSTAEPRLLSTLRSMDPERGMLLRTSNTEMPSSWFHTGALLRMHKDLS